MRGHPDDSTGKSAIARLRLVGASVGDSDSGRSMSNQRPRPKDQRWESSKTFPGEKADTGSGVKQRSQRSLPRGEGKPDEDADLWRHGIAAAVLFSIAVMLSLAAVSIITRSIPAYVEWLPLSGWPVP